MIESRTYMVAATLLFVPGVIILVLSASWQTAIAVFLMLWGNNLAHRAENLRAPVPPTPEEGET